MTEEGKMDQPSWPSAVVAVAIIALVAFMFKLAVDHDFAKIWAGAGTIVGVVTGAIPAYFFHQQAQQAQQRANDANTRAELAAAAADPEKYQQMLETMRLS
jgi:hypothetical protein